MAFKRITENDMLGKGNVGKPDTPGVSTSEMQRIMDELPREVIAPAFNELSGQLEADTASADIGANAPDGITPDPAPAENSPAKLQSVLQGIVNKITDHIADHVKHVASEERTSWNNASNDRHTHDNKSILDGITSSLVGNWNAAFAHVSDAVRHITENERTNWNDKYTKSETDKAINERVVEIGSSDMTKAVYDPETRNLPYIPKIDAEALTLGKNVVLSGTPVSIAYAGANRIDALTLYGENAQGGTTEAPVALTGISSVKVNDDVNELPIPRPLHKVGDVRDVCRTRVKSVYDKRVVLDGSSDEVFIQTNIIDGWIQIATESDAVIPESTSIVGSIKSSYLKAYAIEEVYSKKYSGISVDSNRRIRLSFKTSEYPDVTSVETAKTYLSAHPLTVYYQSTTYDGTNGLDVCLTEYQTGFVELDGTEDFTKTGQTVVDEWMLNGVFAPYTLKPARSSHFVYTNVQQIGSFYINAQGTLYIRFAPGTMDTVSDLTAWLAAQKEAGTPVQIAYQLATPETYATDPLDIDNAAGPLTVMTGGEVEVRMTELIGSRSPEFAGKMDKATYDADGDGVVDEAAAAPWSGITGKPDTFPPSTHNHDDRYYTETETDTKLAGKANSSHTHGVGDISGVLPSTKGGTGANKSVLAISSAVVTTESQGYANVNISTNATICAVVSQGSAAGQCYSIGVIDPKAGGFSIQVKNYQGNPVANTTLRVNYIAYSI